MNPQLRSRPLVFVDDLDHPTLDDKDYLHLSRSLRVRDGEAITVSDGQGRWRLARLGPVAEIEGEVQANRGQTPTTAVGFVPVKGDRSEWVVQKLTEIGVDEILVLTSTRAVVRWDKARAPKKLAKLKTVAKQACMQARRPNIPTVSGVHTIGEAVSAWPGAALADPAGASQGPAPAVILIGPEGGFSPQETRNAPTVVLPGHILRSETAAVVAAVMVQSATSAIPGP